MHHTHEELLHHRTPSAACHSTGADGAAFSRISSSDLVGWLAAESAVGVVHTVSECSCTYNIYSCLPGTPRLQCNEPHVIES